MKVMNDHDVRDFGFLLTELAAGIEELALNEDDYEETLDVLKTAAKDLNRLFGRT
jgi:hypothetical protein